MPVRRSEYIREHHDWYVEPSWTADLLLDALPELDTFHDPCCGWGTIVSCGLRRGLRATGADIADRCGLYDKRDFLTDARRYANIICNPPYRSATRIIDHALQRVLPGGIIAAFVLIAFMASQHRAALHREYCARVFVLSTRPSVPPGELLEAKGESARHSGSTDFCWLVYRPERRAAGVYATVNWLVRTTINRGDQRHV
jgi:hypothetical protein